MKKCLLLFLVLSCLLTIASCSDNEVAYLRFWAIDIGQEGYAKTYASRHCSYQSGELNVFFSIRPKVYSASTAEMESMDYQGREFFIRDDEICWDGVDDDGKWIGGTTYSRCLVWYKDGYECSLSASADRKSIYLDIVCPQTAVSLESGNIPQGLEFKNEFWGVSFKAGEISINVELYPPPFDAELAEKYKGEGEYTLCESDGFKYYVYKPDRMPDDPNAVVLAWETEGGLVCLRGGIPYKYRNDFSEDVWDFIDAELALSITKQIGSVARDIP